MNTCKTMAMLAAAGFFCAVEAMPTRKQLEAAQPLLTELTADKFAEYKAKKIDAADLGDALVEFADQADSEASKFSLLKAAIGFYVRGGKYDKAADSVVALKTAVKDVPPSVMNDILSKAAGRITAKKAPRLYAQYKAARLQANAERQVIEIDKKLALKPKDADLLRMRAEMSAASGDWKSALAGFAKQSGKLASMANGEVDGSVKALALADFWWSYKPLSQGTESVFKLHAAGHYRNALAAKEVAGLKKSLVEKRIAAYADDDDEKESFEAGEQENADEGETPVAEETPQSQDKAVASVKSAKSVSVKVVGKNGISDKNVYTGNMEGEVVWKGDGKTAVVVRGAFVVPQGTSLEIEAGTRVFMDDGAMMVVHGRLAINGTVENPVVFFGSKPGTVTWKTIALGEDSQLLSLDGIYVTGAETGLKIPRSFCGKVQNSAFVENKNGVAYCHGSFMFEECLFSRNFECGALAADNGPGRVRFDHCTFAQNGGTGVALFGGGSFAACVISQNRCGVHNGFKANSDASGCIITGNKQWDVLGDNERGPNDILNYKGNFWGDKATRQLAQKNGKPLATVKDATCGGHGIVDMSEFLTKEPKDCGARVFPSVKFSR